MDHAHLNDPSINSHLVFFKNFISINSNASAASNLMLDRRLARPQRSHLALKKVLNTIDNNQCRVE